MTRGDTHRQASDHPPLLLNQCGCGGKRSYDTWCAWPPSGRDRARLKSLSPQTSSIVQWPPTPAIWRVYHRELMRWSCSPLKLVPKAFFPRRRGYWGSRSPTSNSVAPMMTLPSRLPTSWIWKFLTKSGQQGGPVSTHVWSSAQLPDPPCAGDYCRNPMKLGPDIS